MLLGGLTSDQARLLLSAVLLLHLLPLVEGRQDRCRLPEGRKGRIWFHSPPRLRRTIGMANRGLTGLPDSNIDHSV